MENNNAYNQQTSIQLQETSMGNKSEVEIDSYQNIISINNFGFNKKPIENYNQPASSFTLTLDDVPSKFNKIFSENILKFYKKGKIILVGTAHFSSTSQNEVRDVIRATIPDAIFVELCHSRNEILNMTDEVVLDDFTNPLELIFKCIKREGLTKGLVSALLINYTNELMKKSNRYPGGEFRVARDEGKKIKNAIFGFCDRNIEITLNRLYTKLTFWEKLKLFKDYLYFNVNDNMVKKLIDESPTYINLDDLSVLSWDNFPTFKKVMVDERDQYMATYILQKYNEIFEEKTRTALKEKQVMEAVNIVVVVGYGHISGIKNYFGIEYNLDTLNSIYIPNKYEKSLQFGIQFFIIGGVILTGYYIFKKLG